MSGFSDFALSFTMSLDSVVLGWILTLFQARLRLLSLGQLHHRTLGFKDFFFCFLVAFGLKGLYSLGFSNKFKLHFDSLSQF